MTKDLMAHKHKDIKQDLNLQNGIYCVNYDVKCSCSFSLKYSPVEKTFVNDTSCNWFSILESHVIFDAPLEHFLIILKLSLFYGECAELHSKKFIIEMSNREKEHVQC
jgi:hypothetical protein